jgi:uncharacterized membrane protein YfcA
MNNLFPIFGIALYDGVPAASVAALIGFYLGSFFVKGAIGFGNLSMIILLGALVLPAHHAVLLVVTASGLAQVQFVVPALRDGDWRITRPVIGSYFVAAAIGIWIFGRLKSNWLQVVLGLALGVVLIIDMTKALARLATRFDLRRPGVLYPFSAASGLISGVTGAGGLFFIALYVKQFAPDPKTFRGTILQLGILLTGWRAILLIASGFITIKVFAEAVVLMPFVFGGGFLGSRFYRSLPTRRFYQVVQAVLLFAAVTLVWKGLRTMG